MSLWKSLFGKQHGQQTSSPPTRSAGASQQCKPIPNPISNDATPTSETTAPEEIEGNLIVLGGRITRGPNIEVDAQAIWGAVNELKTMYPDCVFTENTSLDLYPEKFMLQIKVTSTEQRVVRVKEDLLSALARRRLKVYVENDA
jgi:hypothetical protein